MLRSLPSCDQLRYSRKVPLKRPPTRATSRLRHPPDKDARTGPFADIGKIFGVGGVLLEVLHGDQIAGMSDEACRVSGAPMITSAGTGISMQCMVANADLRSSLVGGRASS